MAECSIEKIDTREELAKIANISHGTIHKIETIQEKATPQQIENIRTNNASIHSIYKEIKKVEKKEQIRNEKEKEENAISNLDIRKGDFKDVLIDVFNIDAIITDPPWPKEYINSPYKKCYIKNPTTRNLDGVAVLPTSNIHTKFLIGRRLRK